MQSKDPRKTKKYIKANICTSETIMTADGPREHMTML